MPKSNRERILITGATGFVGANLTHRLAARGQDVHIFVRKGSDTWRIRDILPKLTVHKADLVDEAAVTNAVKKIQPDVVYHVAAHELFLKQEQAEQMIACNIRGAVNLLEALRLFSKVRRIVNVGSFAEYNPTNSRITEASLLEPANAYGVSKASQSLFALYYARLYQLPIVVIRPTVVFGPYEEPRRLIPGTVLAHLRRDSLQLSSPRPRKDFLFVEDALDAMEAAVAKDIAPGEIINIGSGQEHSIRDAVRLIQQLTKTRILLQWGALHSRPWDSAKKYSFHTDKARQLLDWQPQHSLEDGLKETIAWFETHGALYA